MEGSGKVGIPFSDHHFIFFIYNLVGILVNIFVLSLISYTVAKYDFKALLERFAESEFLRNTYSWRWVVKHYEDIIGGAYKDFPKREGKKPVKENMIGHDYTGKDYGVIFEDPEKSELF